MASRRLSLAEMEPLIEPVRALARPLADLAHLDPLLERIGNARYVDDT